MPKSQVLYNLPAARKSTGPIIVCEGPTDCWRIGTNSVALLGKSMSRTQKELLLRHFTGRPIVVLLDSDAQAEAQAIQNELKAVRTSQADDVVIAQLPQGGKDPADFTQEQLLGVVNAAATKRRQDIARAAVPA